MKFTSKKLVLTYILIGVLYFCSGQETDQFAQIGNKVQGTRLHLLTDRLPPVLPEVNLPKMNKGGSPFAPLDLMDTEEELDRELVEMRSKYLPFTKNLAPPINKQRARLNLTQFEWRIQTEKDVKNFMGVQKGDGNWEKVDIPHFGPPEGRATTFYRKTFELTSEMLKYKSHFIHFKGVDYWANVFINGKFIGEHEGFFAPFEFDISPYMVDGENVLLVEVKNDYTTLGSFDGGSERKIGNKIYAASGLGWDDPVGGWHHCPAGMGIYQDCFIESRNPLHINDVFVRPQLKNQSAEVWLEVNNYYEDFKEVSFQFHLFGQNFKDTIFTDLEFIPRTTYVPGVGDLAKPQDWEESRLKMGYEINYLKLTIPIDAARLWNNETPWLYQLQTELIDETGSVADVAATTFGMRSFTQDTISVPKGNMYLNGEMVRMRGANTMGFLQLDVKNKDWDQLVDDILLAKICNMNFIRLTQRPVQSEIYEYADMLGIMLQTDLPLFGSTRQNLFDEGVKQAGEMERLVRNHPSNIMITYINERFPNGEGHPHRSIADADDFYKFFKACDQIVHFWNPDRVIKAGDGDYDPPSPGLPDNHMYNAWYNGHALGLGELHKGYWQKVKPDWLYACGEFGAEAFDNMSTAKKHWPKSWLPENDSDTWFPDNVTKSQAGRFHYMWYPTPKTLAEWIDWSQDHQEWSTRYVTEAFRRDDRMVSFAIHLFIDAWPAGWMKAIMDVDRKPKKAFYAYRNALAPVMVNLRTDKYHFYENEKVKVEAWVCNDLNSAPENYQLKWQLEKDNKVVMASHSSPVFPINGSKFQGYIEYAAPEVEERMLYQLRLALFDEKGMGVSESLINIDIFPKTKAFETNKVYLSNVSEASSNLLNELHFKVESDEKKTSVILIDNYESYSKDKEWYDDLVQSGKTLVFLELPVGSYEIGNGMVNVESTVMGEYYFVNPLSDSKLTKGFKPYDFKFWYDDSKDYVTSILSSLLVVNDDWKPILRSGRTTWVGISGTHAAAMEKQVGKGSYRISQLKLNNHISGNPTAKIFARRLLSSE